MSSETERLTGIFVSAFFADPVVVWFLPSERERRRWLPAGMGFFAELGERYGALSFAASEGWESAGLAIVPPGRYPLPSGGAALALVRAIGRNFGLPLPIHKGWRFLELISTFDAKHPREPHYYVLAVGVRPEFQGRGLCRQLLQPVLDEADRAGVSVYLENSNSRNLPIYRAFGFETVEELLPFAGCPPIWLMRRVGRS